MEDIRPVTIGTEAFFIPSCIINTERLFSISDFLAWPGLKTRVMAQLLRAYSLAKARPKLLHMASAGLGLPWPASRGFVC
jgi:hypothetical protein